MIKRGTVALFSMIAFVAPACARRAPESAVKIPGEPHVSWIIMFGDRDNPDREFACQSAPRTECSIPVSRPDAQVVSEVHFYYHGVKADTNYVGANQIEFFRGTGPHEVRPNVIVKGNETIVNQSVSGIVTSNPGDYVMSIAVVATTAGATRQIHDQVRVVVK